MSWSIGLNGEPESDLVDECLLAFGKAAYLATRFESRCKNLLRFGFYLDTLVAAKQSAGEDAVTRVIEIWANPPADKKLYDTLRDLLARADIDATTASISTLNRAREARNWIAHEGAANLHDISGYGVRWMLDALRELREKVADLAEGDNIVSAWEYSIEEPDEPMPSIRYSYPAIVDDWIFGHVPTNWLDAAWVPEIMCPQTIVQVRSYVPFYSRDRDGCLHGRADAIRRRAEIERRVVPRDPRNRQASSG